MAGGGEGALRRGLCGACRGRLIAEQPRGALWRRGCSAPPASLGLGPPGASFVSPWAERGKSPCNRVVLVAFPLPAPPSSGQAPLQQPPFLRVPAARVVRLGLGKLCNAVAPPPGSQPGSPPPAGGQRRPCRQRAQGRGGREGDGGAGGRVEPLRPGGSGAEVRRPFPLLFSVWGSSCRLPPLVAALSSRCL